MKKEFGKQKIALFSMLGLAAVILVGLVVWLVAVRKPDLNQPQSKQSPASEEVVATEAPTPEPTVNPHEGKVQSPLTGEYISKKLAKQRPFAVMINNIEYANLHQEGTSKLDIVYEALAEGGITRMLGIFQGLNKIKRLGSVRSARHYYVAFANEWNAIYCHFGQTKYAVAKIKKLGIDTLSGLSAIGGVVYRRDLSIKPPHNVYTSGKMMKKGAKQLKYSLKIDESQMAKHYNFYEEDTDLTSDDKTNFVYIPFSEYSTCYFKYDSKKKVYKKFEYKKKHMDHKYNKQLAFKNVIIQIVKETNIDHNGYQQLYLRNGKGEGYYISNGKRMKITWQKKESAGEMCYYDESGNVLTINPGKTYIAAYPKNRRKLISFKNKKKL